MFPRGTLGWGITAFRRTVAPHLSAAQRRRNAAAAAERRAPPPASPLPPTVLPGAAAAAAAASAAPPPQPAAAASPAAPAATSAAPPAAAASRAPAAGGGDTRAAAQQPQGASAHSSRASRSRRDLDRVEAILADGAACGSSSADPPGRPAVGTGSRGPNAHVTPLQHAAYYVHFGELSSMHLHRGKRLLQVPSVDGSNIAHAHPNISLFAAPEFYKFSTCYCMGRYPVGAQQHGVLAALGVLPLGHPALSCC